MISHRESAGIYPQQRFKTCIECKQELFPSKGYRIERVPEANSWESANFVYFCTNNKCSRYGLLTIVYNVED